MSTMQSEEHLISLLDTITALHPAERAALALLAVMYAPVARTPFAQCLQNAGIKSVQGKTVTPAEAALLMDRFVGLNLAVDIKGSYCCNPQLSHILMRQVEKEGVLDRFAQAVQSVIVPRDSWNGLYYRSYAHCVQDIRIALYRGNVAQVSGLLESCSANFAYELGEQHPFALICPEPLDREWIMALPVSLRMLLITFHLDRSLTLLQPTDSTFALLEELMSSRTEMAVEVLKYYLMQLLLRGQVTKAVQVLNDNEALPLHELRGWLAVLQGDDDPAIAHFENGVAALKKETGKRKVFFHDLSGLFYLLALIRSGLPQQLQAAVELGGWVVKQRKHPHQFVVWTLCRYAEVKLGKNRAKEDLEQLCKREQVLEPVSQLFLSLLSLIHI